MDGSLGSRPLDPGQRYAAHRLADDVMHEPELAAAEIVWLRARCQQLEAEKRLGDRALAAWVSGSHVRGGAAAALRGISARLQARIDAKKPPEGHDDFVRRCELEDVERGIRRALASIPEAWCPRRFP